MQDKRVVITGMGAVTPIGLSVDEFWNSMMNSVSGCDYIKSLQEDSIRSASTHLLLQKWLLKIQV